MKNANIYVGLFLLLIGLSATSELIHILWQGFLSVGDTSSFVIGVILVFAEIGVFMLASKLKLIKRSFLILFGLVIFSFSANLVSLARTQIGIESGSNQTIMYGIEISGLNKEIIENEKSIQQLRDRVNVMTKREYITISNDIPQQINKLVKINTALQKQISILTIQAKPQAVSVVDIIQGSPVPEYPGWLQSILLSLMLELISVLFPSFFVWFYLSPRIVDDSENQSGVSEAIKTVAQNQLEYPNIDSENQSRNTPESMILPIDSENHESETPSDIDFKRVYSNPQIPGIIMSDSENQSRNTPESKNTEKHVSRNTQNHDSRNVARNEKHAILPESMENNVTDLNTKRVIFDINLITDSDALAAFSGIEEKNRGNIQKLIAHLLTNNAGNITVRAATSLLGINSSQAGKIVKVAKAAILAKKSSLKTV